MAAKEEPNQNIKEKKLSLGKQCAVWRCESRGLVEFEGSRISSALSFFSFPKDLKMKKIWCNRIKCQDGMYNFRVTKSTRVCEKHFADSDVYRPPGGVKKRLKDGAKPTLHENTSTNIIRIRKASVDRLSPIKKFRAAKNEQTYESENTDDDVNVSFNIEIPEISDDKVLNNNKEVVENILAEQEKEHLQEENEQLRTQLSDIKKQIFTVKLKIMKHVLASDKSWFSFYSNF